MVYFKMRFIEGKWQNTTAVIHYTTGGASAVQFKNKKGEKKNRLTLNMCRKEEKKIGHRLIPQYVQYQIIQYECIKRITYAHVLGLQWGEKKSYQKVCLNKRRRKHTHPNVSPGLSVYIGVPLASAVPKGTVLPHQFWTPTPMPPFLGNCKQKKMTTTETATPESKAADST